MCNAVLPTVYMWGNDIAKHVKKKKMFTRQAINVCGTGTKLGSVTEGFHGLFCLS